MEKPKEPGISMGEYRERVMKAFANSRFLGIKELASAAGGCVGETRWAVEHLLRNGYLTEIATDFYCPSCKGLKKYGIGE